MPGARAANRRSRFRRFLFPRQTPVLADPASNCGHIVSFWPAMNQESGD